MRDVMRPCEQLIRGSDDLWSNRKECGAPVKVRVRGKSYCACHDPEAVERARKKQTRRETESQEAKKT